MMYRQNVAAIVRNAEGKILCCHRRDGRGWQLPQGGIKSGETPEQALVRELWEEIRLANPRILGRTAGTFRYEWPQSVRRPDDTRIGQEQIYFAVTASDDDLARIEHTEDFDQYEWVGADEVVERGIGFKQKIYSEALRELFEKTLVFGLFS